MQSKFSPSHDPPQIASQRPLIFIFHFPYQPLACCIFFNWSAPNVMNIYSIWLCANEELSAFPVVGPPLVFHRSVISCYNADIQSLDSKTAGTSLCIWNHSVWIQNNAPRLCDVSMCIITQLVYFSFLIQCCTFYGFSIQRHTIYLKCNSWKIYTYSIFCKLARSLPVLKILRSIFSSWLYAHFVIFTCKW